MTSYGYPPQAASGWGPTPTYVPPPAKSRLPVIALVVAIGALVMALAAVIVVVVMSGGGPSGPLTGRLAPDSVGRIGGAMLTAEVTRIVENDGGDVGAMACPDTAKVGQGVVTVCHGSISGEEWAVLVVFEDDNGKLTLLPA